MGLIRFDAEIVRFVINVLGVLGIVRRSSVNEPKAALTALMDLEIRPPRVQHVVDALANRADHYSLVGGFMKAARPKDSLNRATFPAREPQGPSALRQTAHSGAGEKIR